MATFDKHGTSESPVVNNPEPPKQKEVKTLNRKGLTREQYYQKELKAIEARRLERTAKYFTDFLDPFTGEKRKGREPGQRIIKKIDDRAVEEIRGAKRRKGVPSRKTVADKKEKVGEPAWKEKLAKQTDQNYIAANFLAFSDLDQRPTRGAEKVLTGERRNTLPGASTTLQNLILVSNYKGNLINKLTSSSKLGPLMNATPFELSQLTPYFRVCKRKGKKLTEFQFLDHLRWTYNLKKDEPLKDILGSNGQGVGFKQFNWQTTGTNLYSAPRTLVATLKLHFQSISELATSAHINHGAEGEDDIRWYDLIVRSERQPGPDRECPTGIPDVDTFLKTDLTPAQAEEWTAKPQKRNDDENKSGFSLMVEVGWKYGVNSTLSEPFRNAVDNSRALLDLTLVSHKFNFREEGTIDLDIEYVARYEGIMSDYRSNIFNLTAEGKNADIFKELEQKKKEIESLESSISSPVGPFACYEDRGVTRRQQRALDKKSEKIDEEISKLEEKAASLTKSLTLSLYGKFTQYLINKNKLLFVDVEEQLYAENSLPPNLISADTVSGPDATESAYVTEVLPSPDENTLRHLQVEDKDDPELTDIDGEKIKKKMDVAFGAKKAKKEGLIRVTFFYLGDLINFYAGVLPDKDANDVDKFEIVLGDLSFLDYGRVANIVDTKTGEALQEGPISEEEQGRVTEEIKETVIRRGTELVVSRNMANLPISFDAYTMWFTDEIVNGDTVFTFKQFIQSLLTKLVVSTLESAENISIGADIRRSLKERTRVKVGVVAGENPHLRRSQLVYEKTNNQGDGEGEGESNLFIKTSTLDPNTNRGTNNRQFFILHGSRLPFASQKVDELENASEGVYHLKIGASKGLVKKIVLERESGKRIRDANIMRAYRQGGAGIGILQEPYNATVTLFGSGFFQPGQYVYINPTNIGLGTSVERYSIARSLGIGGFYIITKVSTGISEGKLETTLKCIFQNYGYLPDSGAVGAGEPIQELRSGRGVTNSEQRIDSTPNVTTPQSRNRIGR